MIIDLSKLRRARKRRRWPLRMWIAFCAQLIADRFEGSRLERAETTNSVYVYLPGSLHPIRISDHAKDGRRIPTHVLPEGMKLDDLCLLLDRAARASYQKRFKDPTPTWEELLNSGAAKADTIRELKCPVSS
jgi:hypothetical protein